jgi:hypothetical protein
MTLVPGQVIKGLSESELLNLSGQLAEIIEDLEEQNGPLFRAIKIWWKNYEAEPPKTSKNRTVPCSGQ